MINIKYQDVNILIWKPNRLSCLGLEVETGEAKPVHQERWDFWDEKYNKIQDGSGGRKDAKYHQIDKQLPPNSL